MTDQVLILVTAILIVVSSIGLAYSVRRLRRETGVNVRTWLLGAGVPAVATLAYLLLGGPPFHFLVVLVVGAIGLAITAALGATRRDGIPRQTGVTMAIWAIVYVLAAVTAFIPRADSQALMAVLLALCAGLAAGTQVGLAMRARPGLATAEAQAAPAWAASPVAPATAAVEPAPPEPAPVAPPPAPVAPPPPSPAEPIHFTHTGQRFLFGYTATYIGIWDLANRQRAQAQYPRTPEGRVAAWSQFMLWEPRPIPVMPYPGLPLGPIADDPVTFSHIGARFAFGHTVSEHSIWDRWSPGPPVARFSVDPQGAAQAWHTFMTWEPRAVSL